MKPPYRAVLANIILSEPAPQAATAAPPKVTTTESSAHPGYPMPFLDGFSGHLPVLETDGTWRDSEARQPAGYFDILAGKTAGEIEINGRKGHWTRTSDVATIEYGLGTAQEKRTDQVTLNETGIEITETIQGKWDKRSFTTVRQYGGDGLLQSRRSQDEFGSSTEVFDKGVPQQYLSHVALPPSKNDAGDVSAVSHDYTTRFDSKGLVTSFQTVTSSDVTDASGQQTSSVTRDETTRFNAKSVGIATSLKIQDLRHDGQVTNRMIASDDRQFDGNGKLTSLSADQTDAYTTGAVRHVTTKIERKADGSYVKSVIDGYTGLEPDLGETVSVHGADGIARSAKSEYSVGGSPGRMSFDTEGWKNDDGSPNRNRPPDPVPLHIGDPLVPEGNSKTGPKATGAGPLSSTEKVGSQGSAATQNKSFGQSSRKRPSFSV